MNSVECAGVSRGFSGWQVCSATALKLLAVVLMLLDHIHQMFAAVGAPIWLTMAGRLVFPLFLFAAAESFHYTRSKKQYLRRLLLASWFMTIFTFLLQWILPSDDVVLINNAFSTFFVAGLYMLFWDWLADGVRQKSPRLIVKSLVCCFIPIICALPVYLVALLSFNESVPALAIRVLTMVSLLLPNILTVEGGYSLVLLGLLFYIFRERRIIQIVVLLILSVLSYVIGGGVQWMMAFAAIPMLLYNGERGGGMKKFFYIFYPLHIGVLYAISTLTI